MSFSQFKQLVKAIAVPTYKHQYVWDIDLEALKQAGIKHLVCDVDNTLISAQQRNMSLRHLNWVQKCKDKGFHVYILSNNRSYKRIRRICDHVQCKGYYLAMKPLGYSLRHMSDIFDFSLEETAVVGDQVSTDIFLANWCKTVSILVEPVDDVLSPIKRLQYSLERALLRYAET